MYTQQIKNHFFSSKSYEYADTRKNVDVCEKNILKASFIVINFLTSQSQIQSCCKAFVL